jgi:hypothetical protein
VPANIASNSPTPSAWNDRKSEIISRMPVPRSRFARNVLHRESDRLLKEELLMNPPFMSRLPKAHRSSYDSVNTKSLFFFIIRARF